MTTTSTPAGNAVSHDPVDQRPGQDAGMTTTTRPAHAADPQPGRNWRDGALWLRESGLSILGYLILATTVTAGWSGSFIHLREWAMTHMDFSTSTAFVVPTTYDAGALGMSIGVARAAMHGRSAPLQRLMVVAFTALSAWINWGSVSDATGRFVSSLLPVAAVIVFESLMSEARKAYERRTRAPRPRLSVLRWVFDFHGTRAILRAYVLGQPLPEQMEQAADALKAEEQAAEEARRARRKKAKPTGKAPAKVEKPAPADTEPVAAEQDPRHAANAEVISLTASKNLGDRMKDIYVANRVAMETEDAEAMTLSDIEVAAGGRTENRYVYKVLTRTWMDGEGRERIDQALNGERRHG